MLVELVTTANLEVNPMAFVLLKTPDVTRMLGISITKLEHMRSAGQGPTWIKVGRSVRYRPAEIEAYLEANTYRQK